ESEPVTLPPLHVQASAPANPGGVDGYKSGSTRSATRTDTPLIDVPQAVSVITQDMIHDQAILRVTDAVRYVPGITVHQGESNRDQVIIRGNSTSADFFIDGARDDVQYFRDLYNIDRVEILKAPNALAFGRGGSGGLVNRVSKEADGSRVRQAVLAGGSFDNKRIQFDIGDRITDRVALRGNAVYENAGTFRQYGDLERWGINPAGGLTIDESTGVQLG